MNTLYELDYGLLLWLQNHGHNVFLDVMMPIITSLGDKGLIWILIGVALTITKKYRKMGIMVLISIALCGITGNLLLKNIVARARPFDLDPMAGLLVPEPQDYSFPSGHTQSGFAAATSIYLCKRRMGIYALCLAAVIAYSRLYLYVHYPSDVLVGGVLGIVIAFVSRWMVARTTARI